MNTARIFMTTVAAMALLALATTGCGRIPAPEGEVEQTTVTESEPDTQSEGCPLHDLPVTECFICDPSLREPGRLWCAGHDRYEDRCFLRHPELEDPSRLWCAEHNLYEDECFLCHPELSNGTRLTAVVTSGLHCREHDVPEDEEIRARHLLSTTSISRSDAPRRWSRRWPQSTGSRVTA